LYVKIYLSYLRCMYYFFSPIRKSVSRSITRADKTSSCPKRMQWEGARKENTSERMQWGAMGESENMNEKLMGWRANMATAMDLITRQADPLLVMYFLLSRGLHVQ